MLLELHCHSSCSRGKKIPAEGIGSPAEIVRAAKRLGLDGIALTDHITSRGWKEAGEEAKKQGLAFIPGIEISSLGGHVIGLGLNGHIESGLSLEETLEKIREQGAVSVAAHPFDLRREGTGKNAAKADVIEAFNSMNLEILSNRLAGRLAKREGKPSVGGSDSHTPAMLGACPNELDAHDLDSCLKEIKAGRVSFRPRYIPLEDLISWTRQRFSLSHADVLKYIEANYWQPKKWVSQRMLHVFLDSRREWPWQLLGGFGIRSSQAYGLLRAFTSD